MYACVCNVPGRYIYESIGTLCIYLYVLLEYVYIHTCIHVTYKCNKHNKKTAL